MTSPSSSLDNVSPPRRYFLSRRSSSRSSIPTCPKSQPTIITTPPMSRRGSGIPIGEDGMFKEGIFTPMIGETDAQCWQRMLRLQRDYHCYNSARLEAAVEAEERGEEVINIPSRLCLDLLDDDLRSFFEAQKEGFLA